MKDITGCVKCLLRPANICQAEKIAEAVCFFVVTVKLTLFLAYNSCVFLSLKDI